MLVRLLGEEETAKAGQWDIPFTDVVDWAKPYVGYAYAHKLISGTSATTFSGDGTITASQYLTFVLRALGYESGADFRWDAAWELSDQIGLTHGEYHQRSGQFLRLHVTKISLGALATPEKTGDKTLAQELIDRGTFTQEDYQKAAGTAPDEAPDPDAPEDGTFTRAELAELIFLFRYAQLDPTPYAASYGDCADLSMKVRGYIGKLVDEGIMEPVGDGFDPEGLVSREEMAFTFWKAIGSPEIQVNGPLPTDFEKVREEVKPAIRYLYARGYIQDEKFFPKSIAADSYQWGYTLRFEGFGLNDWVYFHGDSMASAGGVSTYTAIVRGKITTVSTTIPGRLDGLYIHCREDENGVITQGEKLRSGGGITLLDGETCCGVNGKVNWGYLDFGDNPESMTTYTFNYGSHTHAFIQNGDKFTLTSDYGKVTGHPVLADFVRDGNVALLIFGPKMW